jgi:hypothetical protein
MGWSFLAMMNDDAFARLVAEEVKNKVTDAQRNFIELPENRDRWKRALTALNSTLQAQLDELDRREEADSARYQRMGADGTRLIELMIQEVADKRKKVERFKFFVEQRIGTVSTMPVGEPARPDGEIFREAIEAHKALMAAHDYEPTPIDIALWGVLDGKWLFESIPEGSDR